MKAGDLIRWHKKYVANGSDVDNIILEEKILIGVVIEDYEKHTKIITALIDGSIKRIHASEVSLLKRARGQ